MTIDIGALMSNDDLVDRDLKIIRDYVKDDLFYKVIFIFKEDALREGEKLYNDFIKKCTSTVADGCFSLAGEPHRALPYMRFLWSRLLQEKCYKEWVSVKRSNAYQAVQDKFLCKYTMGSTPWQLY